MADPSQPGEGLKVHTPPVQIHTPPVQIHTDPLDPDHLAERESAARETVAEWDRIRGLPADPRYLILRRRLALREAQFRELTELTIAAWDESRRAVERTDKLDRTKLENLEAYHRACLARSKAFAAWRSAQTIHDLLTDRISRPSGPAPPSPSPGAA